jgi:hypothetical protein
MRKVRQNVDTPCGVADRPDSDRALYYELLKAFCPEQRIAIAEPVCFYEALLYWKLYSQNTNLKQWLQDPFKRMQVQKSLIRLFQRLPASLERIPSVIVNEINKLDEFQLPGMASSCALPVRTTFLHFIYPSVVPIFDKMVLQAVGAWYKGANQSTEVLMEYLPFAWELSDRYARQVSIFEKEGPIRVIDMALWVVRGQEASISEKSVTSAQVPMAPGQATGRPPAASAGVRYGVSRQLSIPDAMDRAGKLLQQRYGNRPIPRADLIREVLSLGNWSEGSIMPYDFCYNRENKGSRPLNQRVFLEAGGGQYKYVGRNYLYSGPVARNPRLA